MNDGTCEGDFSRVAGSSSAVTGTAAVGAPGQQSASPTPKLGEKAETVVSRRSCGSTQTRKSRPRGPITPIRDVDELISLIYQGPLEAEPWRGFLQALRRRLDCDITAMTIRPNGAGIAEVLTWDSDRILDSAWREQYLEGVLRRLQSRDPLGNALTRSGSLYTLDEVLPREELVKSEFYLSLMEPYGIEYQLGMCFCEPSGWKCNIGVINGPDRQNFGEEEKNLFGSFHSHLERALELYARLRLNESEKEIFEDTLDRLTIGTFILDGRGNVIGANQVARDIVRRTSCIAIANDRIVLRSRDADNRFHQLIKDALVWRREQNPENFVDVLRIESPDALKLDLLVRTIAAGERRNSDASPGVIVYVGDSVQQKLAPERFVAQLFGLTPTEAFLATLLANGYTLMGAAEKLEVTENTVRSYAKRIFAKTGVSRQVDLVRLIMKSVALLA